MSLSVEEVTDSSRALNFTICIKFGYLFKSFFSNSNPFRELSSGYKSRSSNIIMCLSIEICVSGAEFKYRSSAAKMFFELAQYVTVQYIMNNSTILTTTNRM